MKYYLYNLFIYKLSNVSFFHPQPVCWHCSKSHLDIIRWCHLSWDVWQGKGHTEHNLGSHCSIIAPVSHRWVVVNCDKNSQQVKDTTRDWWVVTWRKESFGNRRKKLQTERFKRTSILHFRNSKLYWWLGARRSAIAHWTWHSCGCCSVVPCGFQY